MSRPPPPTSGSSEGWKDPDADATMRGVSPEEEDWQEDAAGEGPALIKGGWRAVLQTVVAVVLVVVAIYVLLPRLLDVEDAIGMLGEANVLWIAVALCCGVLMYAAYVALFRGVVGEQVLHLEWSESYQITMAGLAATRLFSAGGAGGIVLTYWALRKAGLPRRRSAQRMVAFLVLLYAVYMLALIVFGVLLRVGVLPGQAPLSVTIVPAGVAGAVVVFFLLIALVPANLDRRLAAWAEGGGRISWLASWMAKIPAALGTGTRQAIAFLRRPSHGALAVAGAVGFWAANITILWASFKAFGVSVPVGVLVQGFFVGMVANLLPFAPGGVGAVDAGMIGAFAIFGLPGPEVFAAVLWYRLIAFWLPIPPGVVAYFQLRRTVARWEERGQHQGDLEPARSASEAASGA